MLTTFFVASCQRKFSVYVWTHSSPSSEGHAQAHFLGFPFNKYKALICCIIAPCHTQDYVDGTEKGRTLPSHCS